MQKHFHELKHQMNRVRERERGKLTKLTLESDTAIKELKKKKEKVNYVLSSPSKLSNLLFASTDYFSVYICF